MTSQNTVEVYARDVVEAVGALLPSLYFLVYTTVYNA